ncbi:hypothetical protein C8R43DRAFT_1024050 [Mycena crocata]|nr:hypothetical protein C8R43DRAFT_1024050 [Mycena crocata]
MFFNAILLLSALTFAAAVPQDIPEPFTVTRVFKSITDVAPFIVQATTTFTFTSVPTRAASNLPLHHYNTARALRRASHSPPARASKCNAPLPARHPIPSSSLPPHPFLPHPSSHLNAPFFLVLV